ncbi:hypothetical protein [Methylorubrum extorquens]
MSLRSLLFGEPRCAVDASLVQLMDEFRQERSDTLAQLSEEGARRGAQLAMARQDATRWRHYALALERICLAHGLDLPRGPDE